MLSLIKIISIITNNPFEQKIFAQQSDKNLDFDLCFDFVLCMVRFVTTKHLKCLVAE